MASGTPPLVRPGAARWPLLLAGLFAVAGFLLAAQVRTELLIRRHLQVPGVRLGELGVRLQELEHRRAVLEAELAELRDQIAVAEREAAVGQSSLARQNRRVRDLRVLAGLVPLEGPGVAVELRDSPRPIRPGEDPNKTILHYTDLHAVVNDLWAAGADAVAINGERLVGTTGISCVGTTILCNTKRLAPPYRLEAIGDPDALVRYLRRPGGPLEVLAAFGFPVQVTPQARVRVPAYRGILHVTYARPQE